MTANFLECLTLNGGALLALDAETQEAACLALALACMALLHFIMVYLSLSKWLRVSRYRKKLKKLSRNFAAAYEAGLAGTATRWVDLPIMPVRTPYSAGAETTIMSTSIAANDAGAFVDAFVAEFYETTGGDVALTRGDNHNAATGRTRVVLAVKAVQRKGELAIAALTVKPVGRIANVSIRWSCWPKSIWPGQGGNLPLSLSSCDVRTTTSSGGIDWEATWHNKYFKPRDWNRSVSHGDSSYSVVPDFLAETESEAQDLARIMNIVLSQMTRTGASGL